MTRLAIHFLRWNPIITVFLMAYQSEPITLAELCPLCIAIGLPLMVLWRLSKSADGIRRGTIMTNAEHFDQQYLIELDGQIYMVRNELADSARKWKESGLFYRLFNRDINKVIDRLEKLERMKEKARAEMVVKYGTGFEEIKDTKEKVQ